MENNFNPIFSKIGFNFILSMDCEGYIFDKNLKENVLNLEKMLDLNTEHNIFTILFITPHFANMLYDLKLVERIKEKYKVIFGLHIHPNDFPEEIQEKCYFARKDENLVTAYSYIEQILMVKSSADYLRQRGINNLEGFRGGYFGIDDNTAKAVVETTDIYFESHNIYRSQYKISNKILQSYPVYAFDDSEEFRLEYFDLTKLLDMLNAAAEKKENILAITHSYLLKDDDIHYKMKNIISEIKKLG